MKRYLALFIPLLLVACQDGQQPLSPAGESAFAVATDGSEYAPGRLLARFSPGANVPAVAAAHGVSVEREIALGIQMLKVPAGRELAVAQALARNPNVVWAEPDFIRTFGEPCKLDGGACTKPADPFFGYKWDLHNNGKIVNSLGEQLATTGQVDADMDWLEAFNHLGTSTGAEVRLGILDTGIRADHQEFVGKIVAQYNFHSGNANADDDDGHGTHVAGIATALGNDGNGVPGVAYGANVKLVIAKVCGPLSPPLFGQRYGCYSSSIVNGITWTADEGAAVMNLSLGGSSASQAEQDALQYARDQGSLPICAAGNNGTGSVSYPARFPQCVAVSATNWSDGLASYSNWGPEIDLSAPGGDRENSSGYSYILSAYRDSPSSYAFMAGTSMASPQVAGLAILLRALGMTDHTAKLAHMRNTADDLGTAGWDSRFGHGRINIYRAVKDFDGGTLPPGDDPPENNPPTASFTYFCSELTCSFSDTSIDSDGSVVGWSWDFGDGATSTAQHPSHTYAGGGTYTVSLTVTDDDGATGTTSQNVTVTAPSTGAITLTATGSKVQGRWRAVLNWSGSDATSFDIYRQGSWLATVSNTSSHTDQTNFVGSGSLTYKVCVAGSTSNCSNEATATF